MMIVAASTAGRWRRNRRAARGAPWRASAPCHGERAAGTLAIIGSLSPWNGPLPGRGLGCPQNNPLPLDRAWIAQTELAVLYPRIDHRIADVDQRVDGDVAAGHQQDRRLQDRVVAAKDRVHRVLAQARNGED